MGRNDLGDFLVIIYMEIEGQKSPLGRTVFTCDECDYNTNNKKDFNKHILTAKHKMMLDRMTEHRAKIPTDQKQYTCNCGNNYKYKQGLYVHKQKCTRGTAEPVPLENTIVLNTSHTKVSEAAPEITALPCIEIPSNFVIPNHLFMRLFKENQEFKSMIVEQQQVISTLAAEKENVIKTLLVEKQQGEKDNKELINKIVENDEVMRRENKELMNKMAEITQQQLAMIPNVTNNNTVNNNQRFNLNVFLNETCKDAMNLDEFLDGIRPTFEELLVMGDVGFVAGISEIFIKRLRELDITKRPIHCTDARRETIFLKENDTWNKDENGHAKLKSIIEKVEYRNVVALHKWCTDNPDAMINNHEKNLLRDKIYLQTLLGDPDTRDKVVRNIAKEVTLDKEAIMFQRNNS